MAASQYSRPLASKPFAPPPDVKTLTFAVLLAITLSCHAAEYVDVPGGTLRTALPTDGSTVQVAPYRMRTAPVTNQEFLGFITATPQWQRQHIAAVFAGPGYLDNWRSPQDFAPAQADAPVTAISWFAAQAFCQSEQARLPTWYEWEFAAAADETRRDARDDPAWRARILSWYETPGSQALPAVGQDKANIYGIHNLHQTIWEWVDDYNGLFVTADSRDQGAQQLMETCGAAALSLGDRENYAVLMRIALLSALSGKDTVNTLGFRCVRP